MAKTLVYQIWPLAWGGLNEMAQHLGRVKKLGTDYVWLGPIYLIPNYSCDDGLYGYKTIDQRFGTMQDFDQFMSVAHELGLKVLMELSVDPVYPYLSHAHQSRWFNEGRINHKLVRTFQSIVKFWLHKHQVDGFSIKLSQNTDEDIVSGKAKFPNTMSNAQATTIINEIFSSTSAKTSKGEDPFLVIECFDASCDSLVDYYHCYGMANLVMNRAVRNAIENGLGNFKSKLITSSKNSNFMLGLESPNTARFATRSRLSPEEVISLMFDPVVDAKAICIYQGQEMGCVKSTRKHLPMELYHQHGYCDQCRMLVERWKKR